jgi:ATP-dependent DNA helicase RecG
VRPSALYSWFAPVTSLKYIGPASTAALARLLRPTRVIEETETRDPVIRDLLFHLPTSLTDRRVLSPVNMLVPRALSTVEVTIDEHVPPPRYRQRAPYKVLAHDATGTVVLNFFHVKGDYLTRQLPAGSKRIISGTMELYEGIPTIVHPDVIAPVEKAAEVLTLCPNYPLTAGLSQKTVVKALGQSLERVTDLPEWLDAAYMQQQKFLSLKDSLRAMHFPKDEHSAMPDAPAHSRLAYDELLANQLALALARRLVQRQKSYAIVHNADIEQRWRAALPFQLTAGQNAILKDIATDVSEGMRMVRLLQGDVGSGKTILAFAVMAQVAAQGLQSALMAPTDLLARQHLISLQPLAEALGLRMRLLSGKMRKAEQQAVREGIEAGDFDIVVGTHALFQDQVNFHKLALIVVDEQHRFGVAQRMRFAAKGKSPHLLQMSATPIPRSLTMTLYGDMEISTLSERPPGRKEIDTRAMPIARAQEVIEALARVMDAGEKAYWVCPLIETPDEAQLEAGGLDLAAAEERFAVLSARFPERVGLVHGRMKLAEREKVMQAYANGKLQLLVATTVIEVGVNVPEATVMVIEQAERFGLAQLHQLRGRVGRSDKSSRCVLLYDEPLSELAKSRLKILRETNDGFRIAEEDMRLRGVGDMLGTKQTGMPDFILADLAHHLPLLRTAHEDVKLVLSRDPELTSERGLALRLLLQLYEYDAAIAQLKSV